MPQPSRVLLLTISISLWPQRTHLLMATSSRMTHHVTKLKSSQTGFLSMTACSLYSSGLHSDQISVQWSTIGMWWNRRFASWMCSSCVMLSCQYWPKSLRNVSNTLLKVCHKELRHFWRQKGVQPGTSKAYLIRWLVNVHLKGAICCIWTECKFKTFKKMNVYWCLHANPQPMARSVS